MALESTMLPLGTKAPAFRLPDFQGRVYSIDDFATSPALLVAFICNHCPYVKHIRAEFARFAREYSSRGVAVVAINANDIEAYPQDGPAGMEEESRTAGYTFPYLFDESQKVARAYHAVCTPEFFCSIARASSCIAVSSTPAGRRTDSPSRARTLGPHAMHC